MGGTTHSTEYQGVKQRQYISGRIMDYLPVLDFPDDLPGDRETFTMKDLEEHDGSDVQPEDMTGRHRLQQMHLDGLLAVVSEGDGGAATEYRWRPEGRRAIEDYLEDVDTLPCSCRKHIPDSRDDPEGVITCRYCGEPYPEDRFTTSWGTYDAGGADLRERANGAEGHRVSAVRGTD